MLFIILYFIIYIYILYNSYIQAITITINTIAITTEYIQCVDLCVNCCVEFHSLVLADPTKSSADSLSDCVNTCVVLWTIPLITPVFDQIYNLCGRKTIFLVYMWQIYKNPCIPFTRLVRLF